MDFQEDSSNEEKDVKPIISPTPKSNPEKNGEPVAYDLSTSTGPNLSSGSKKWSPRSLQDTNRKSAFLPYKQHTTVLTNLQRGNTQAETPVPQSAEINFHIKAGQGELSIQDVLNEKCIDVLDCSNLTALHWACAYGQTSTVQMLLKHGASVNKLGPEEESPLHLAASGGHHEAVRMLIKAGADVNRVDHLCNTPLMYSAKGNHPHTCQELLLHGADFSLINLDDGTAHSIAMDNNSTLARTVIENFIISKLENTIPITNMKTEDNT